MAGKSLQESLSNLMKAFCRGHFWHHKTAIPTSLLAKLFKFYLFIVSVLPSHIFREDGPFTAERDILL